MRKFTYIFTVLAFCSGAAGAYYQYQSVARPPAPSRPYEISDAAIRKAEASWALCREQKAHRECEEEWPRRNRVAFYARLEAENAPLLYDGSADPGMTDRQRRNAFSLLTAIFLGWLFFGRKLAA